MKGYCGHITHLSVVSDFEILIFCLFIYFLVCLYLVLCWFCKRKMVQSFWRKITFCIFVKKIHCQHQQGLGSQKYFWCLDLEIFKFISQTIFTKLCMLFLIVCKKNAFRYEHWTRPLQTMSFLFNPLYQGNRRHSWSWVWVLILGNGKYKHV